MTDPKIAELIALSGRATQGEWKVSAAGTLIAGKSRHIIGDYIELPDAKLLAALVNWFRETYTKERA